MPIRPARRAEAIAAAVDVFGRDGFADGSIDDVIAASGGNRHTIYSGFGDKRGLLVAALRSYVEEADRQVARRLEDPTEPPVARIAALLNEMADAMIADQRGCFACLAAAETARGDPEIRGLLLCSFEAFEARVTAALNGAEASLNPNLSAEDAALLVVASRAALATMARAGASRAALGERIQALTRALSAPAP